MALTLNIQNPNSKPADQAVLYLGEGNTINLVFTKKGNVRSPKQGDTFTVVFSKTLLASASADNLASGQPWTAQVASSAASYTFNFSPTQDVSFDENGEITIQLINLQGVTDTNDNVSSKFKIGGRPLSGNSLKLVVMDAPTQPKNFPDFITIPDRPDINLNNGTSIPNGTVYISPVTDQSQLAVPVANTIHVNLKFDNKTGGLVDKWEKSKVPKFIFSFATGSSSVDLTDNHPSTDKAEYNELTSAWNIKAEIGEGESSQWQAPKQSKTGISPTWTVSPTSTNQSLFSASTPNLDVVFTHVISILPPGEATLYIQWASIPGFNDGIKALNLPKAIIKPTILSFQGPANTPNFNDVISLKWQTFGVASLNLSWDKQRAINGIKAFDTSNPQLAYSGEINKSVNPNFVIDSEETVFLLDAYDASGKEMVDSTTTTVTVNNFPGPSINNFSGQLNLANNAPTGFSFSWLADNVGDAGTISIDGKQVSNPGEYNGFPGQTTISIQNPEKPVPLDHSIEVNQNNNNVGEKSTKEITVITPTGLTPKIVSFTSFISRDGNGNATSVTLAWQVQNAVYSKADSSKNTYCQINNTSASIQYNSVDGNGTITIPISPNSPILSRYVLEVSNPGAGSARQTLKLNFNKNRVIPVSGVSAEGIALSTDGSFGVAAISQANGNFSFGKFSTGNVSSGLTPLSSYAYGNGNLTSFGLSPDSDGDNQQVFTNTNFLYVGLLNSYGTYGPFYSLNGNPGLAFSPSSTAGQNFAWVGAGSSIVAFPRMPGNYPTPSNPNKIIFLEQHIISYQQKANWWQPEIDITDLAITKDGSRIFVADFANGFVHYFDTKNIPTHLDDQYSPIMESYQVQSISIYDNEYAYWLGHCDPNDGRQNHYPAPSVLLHSLHLTQSGGYGYHPWIPIPYTGSDSALMKVIAAKNFVLVTSPGENLFHLVAGAPFNFEDTAANILQTVSVEGINNLVVMPDNTRIFVAASDGIEVWEAQLVKE